METYKRFKRAYIECALWSTLDDNDQPLDSYPVRFSEELDRIIEADCRKFFELSEHFDCEYEKAGHDFWLTRNGHGAGFWDGDWAEPAATVLDKASREFVELYLYLGDNGLLYAG